MSIIVEFIIMVLLLQEHFRVLYHHHSLQGPQELQDPCDQALNPSFSWDSHDIHGQESIIFDQ